MSWKESPSTYKKTDAGTRADLMKVWRNERTTDYLAVVRSGMFSMEYQIILFTDYETREPEGFTEKFTSSFKPDLISAKGDGGEILLAGFEKKKDAIKEAEEMIENGTVYDEDEDDS